MNDSKNKNKKIGLTKTQFILSLFTTLIVGIFGTYALMRISSEPKKEIATEETSELKSDIDLETLFATPDELNVINQLYTILKTSYYEEIDSEILSKVHLKEWRELLVILIQNI